MAFDGKKNKTFASITDRFQLLAQLNDHVYEVHKPAGRPSVEIVFFHGLQLEGSKDIHLTTWLSADGAGLWLSWILRDISNARILLVSYDAFAQRKDDQGRMDMYLTGENLVHSLTEERSKVGGDGCPVIFVAHSIGGLVTKELMFRLHTSIRQKEAEQNLLRNVKGFFFYGCPHLGSRFADIFSNSMKGPLLEFIKTLNNEAQRRNEDFRALGIKHGWKTYGIGEGRPTELVSTHPSLKNQSHMLNNCVYSRYKVSSTCRTI
jgi:hypothetical protein